MRGAEHREVQVPPGQQVDGGQVCLVFQGGQHTAMPSLVLSLLQYPPLYPPGLTVLGCESFSQTGLFSPAFHHSMLKFSSI